MEFVHQWAYQEEGDGQWRVIGSRTHALRHALFAEIRREDLRDRSEILPTEMVVKIGSVEVHPHTCAFDVVDEPKEVEEVTILLRRDSKGWEWEEYPEVPL